MSIHARISPPAKKLARQVPAQRPLAEIDAAVFNVVLTQIKVAKARSARRTAWRTALAIAVVIGTFHALPVPRSCLTQPFGVVCKVEMSSSFQTAAAQWQKSFEIGATR